ncbi:hypothetical protein BCO71033_03233 [Burkholderia contaminans]|uniref:Xcc1710-like domain-containing protein n=1 Tax=Burkholderia contaminans TaxID=488447 RepID=A0A6P2YQC0_9BURK|nr:hypothetical protein BCO71033_03233 [Burkholderia contaminans]
MHHSRAGPAPSGVPRARASETGHPGPCGPAIHSPTEPRNTDLKLHQDTSGALNTVTGYGPDYVDVNLERHETSVIVLPGAPVRAWPVSSFDALAPEHFAMLLDPTPELVIFGSGARLRFPHPRLVAALTAKRIGVETMDFQAACRTYNILMAEGRKVAAALLIER